MTAPEAEEGNAEAGYKYLVEGNAFNAGIPIEIYNLLKGIKGSKLAQVAGYGKFAINDFVVFKNDNGRLTATPGCLYCHAQEFNNEFIIGLGNSYSNFQANTAPYIKLLETAIKIRYGKKSNEWKRLTGFSGRPGFWHRIHGPKCRDPHQPKKLLKLWHHTVIR